MANAIVESLLGSGLGTLTLKLFPSGSDTIANWASGDTAAESTNRKGHYAWTVTEGLTGLHTAHISNSGGVLIGIGYVWMTDDTTVHHVGDLASVMALAIDGKTMIEAQRIIAAAAAGKISGAGTGTEVAKGLDGSTTRATFTVDSAGNRTAVTY